MIIGDLIENFKFFGLQVGSLLPNLQPLPSHLLTPSIPACRQAGLNPSILKSLPLNHLIRILVDEAFPEGEPHNLKIQPEGPLFDIFQVALNSLFSFDDIIQNRAN